MKRSLSGVLSALLVTLLALADVAGSALMLPAAAAELSPTITLNGTVDATTPGFVDGKTVVMSTGTETKVTYRLVPDYSEGSASGVRVTINLPSLDYVDGEYQIVPGTSAPTPLGVQGRVNADDTWVVLSPTTVNGGQVVLQYEGDLDPGENPAFDLFLSAYNDGTDGPYGGVPEGTSFELSGFVQYDSFNRAEDSGWTTPHNLDDNSRVNVVSSDLTWEASLESYPVGQPDLVPIWDRYQYIDYVYTLSNTSENLNSNIEGYTSSFLIDSQDRDGNGIIPFDITRWRYVAGEGPVANDDQNDDSGQFVGVPGEGGILIYDITDWDGESELTDPVPYSYAGSGEIVIDRQHGAARQALTPDGAAGPSENRYLISVPLSRQGFPNPPTNFRITTVTDVLFATSAQWSKTMVTQREITLPSYEFSFSHTTAQPEVVYGYETSHVISQLRSESNAPIFDPTVVYAVDPDFALDRVSYELDAAAVPRFTDAGVSYSFLDEETDETVTETISDYVLECVDPANDGTEGDDEESCAGTVRLTFDVAVLNDLDSWDHTITLGLVDRMEPFSELPVSISVFGTPYRVDPAMEATATAVYIEKIASNDDFGEQTSYTEVPHEVERGTSINVIYPDEIVPQVAVSIDDAGEAATVPFEERTRIDFSFGVNDDTVAENSTTTLTVNGAGLIEGAEGEPDVIDPDANEFERLRDAQLTLVAALFEQAANVRVRYLTLDGDTGHHRPERSCRW